MSFLAELRVGDKHTRPGPAPQSGWIIRKTTTIILGFIYLFRINSEMETKGAPNEKVKETPSDVVRS